MNRRKPIKLNLGAEVEGMVRDNSVARAAPPEAAASVRDRTPTPETTPETQVPSEETAPKPAARPRASRPRAAPQNEPSPQSRVSVEIPFTDPATVSEVQATARRSNVPVSRVLGVYVREAKERLLTELASKRTIKGPHVPRESVLTTFKTTLTFEDRDLERIQGDLDPDRVMSRSLALARAIAAEIKTRK